jgi:signal transduction histidine kinase
MMPLNEMKKNIDAPLDESGLSNSLPNVDTKLNILKIELLKKIDLFSLLPLQTLDVILEKSSDVVLKKDEILFKEGITANMMYVILSGKVLIYNKRKRITVLGQGEYFGEMSLIDEKCRSASARAMGNVMMMEIPGDLFSQFIFSNSQALFQMMKVLSHRIRSDLDEMSSDVLRACNFTHDMRNCLVPLGIAEALLEEAIIALRGKKQNHKSREGLEQVKKSFDTLVSVKNNLITLIDQSLGGVNKTKAEYVRAKLDILPLINETVDEISCHKYLKNKKVRVVGEGKVKKGYFNYLDIKRVLQNLLINAGYVTKNNGEIIIKVKDMNDMIQISVIDHGCGIADEIKPFLLKETYTTKPDGNGFGLVSSRELIEEFQKGRIWFESEVDDGTTFHFTIPHAA